MQADLRYCCWHRPHCWKNQAYRGSTSRTVYHGGDTDVPGMRRYRLDAIPVETRLLPASSRFTTVFDSLPDYSRWVPVVLNILQQPGTWAGSTRFNTVHPGSPRLSTVPPRLWHGSPRFIPDHQTGMNRHLKPGQWEWGFKVQFVQGLLQYLLLCPNYPERWKSAHIKGRLLYQATILYNYVPFQNRNFSERKEFAPRGSEFFSLRAVP